MDDIMAWCDSHHDIFFFRCYQHGNHLWTIVPCDTPLWVKFQCAKEKTLSIAKLKWVWRLTTYIVAYGLSYIWIVMNFNAANDPCSTCKHARGFKRWNRRKRAFQCCVLLSLQILNQKEFGAIQTISSSPNSSPASSKIINIYLHQ